MICYFCICCSKKQVDTELSIKLGLEEDKAEDAYSGVDNESFTKENQM